MVGLDLGGAWGHRGGVGHTSGGYGEKGIAGDPEPLQGGSCQNQDGEGGGRVSWETGAMKRERGCGVWEVAG